MILTKIPKELTNENEKLLRGIKDRQMSLNRLSQYLSQLESQLALIFAASPDIIVFLDEEEKIVKISDAAFTLLGYTKAEMVGQSVWNFISPKDVYETKRHFKELSEKKMVYFDNTNRIFVNHWISKTKELVKLMWRFSLCDERQKYTIGVATDISQFKTNDIYNFKLMQKAMDSSNDGIVIVDVQNGYTVVYTNKSYEVMTGYQCAELIGTHLLSLQTEDNKNSRVLKTLLNCLSEGKSCDVLLEFKNKNKEIFYNRMAISAVVEHGIIVNFIAVCRDITEKIGTKYEWSPNSESGFIHLSK